MDVGIAIKGSQCEALVDSGATHNYVSTSVVERLGITVSTED